MKRSRIELEQSYSAEEIQALRLEESRKLSKTCNELGEAFRVSKGFEECLDLLLEGMELPCAQEETSVGLNDIMSSGSFWDEVLSMGIELNNGDMASFESASSTSSTSNQEGEDTLSSSSFPLHKTEQQHQQEEEQEQEQYHSSGAAELSRSFEPSDITSTTNKMQIKVQSPALRDKAIIDELKPIAVPAPVSDCSTAAIDAAWTELTKTKAGTDMLLRVDETPLAIVVTENRSPFRIQHVNAAWVRMCEFSRDEAVGQTLRMIQGPATCTKTLDQIMSAVRLGQPTSAEVVNYTKSGKAFRNRMRIHPVVNENGRITNYLGLVTDARSYNISTGHSLTI